MSHSKSYERKSNTRASSPPRRSYVPKTSSGPKTPFGTKDTEPVLLNEELSPELRQKIKDFSEKHLLSQLIPLFMVHKNRWTIQSFLSAMGIMIEAYGVGQLKDDLMKDNKKDLREIYPVYLKAMPKTEVVKFQTTHKQQLTQLNNRVKMGEEYVFDVVYYFMGVDLDKMRFFRDEDGNPINLESHRRIRVNIREKATIERGTARAPGIHTVDDCYYFFHQFVHGNEDAIEELLNDSNISERYHRDMLVHAVLYYPYTVGTGSPYDYQTQQMRFLDRFSGILMDYVPEEISDRYLLCNLCEHIQKEIILSNTDINLRLFCMMCSKGCSASYDIVGDILESLLNKNVEYKKWVDKELYEQGEENVDAHIFEKMEQIHDLKLPHGYDHKLFSFKTTSSDRIVTDMFSRRLRIGTCIKYFYDEFREKLSQFFGEQEHDTMAMMFMNNFDHEKTFGEHEVENVKFIRDFVMFLRKHYPENLDFLEKECRDHRLVELIRNPEEPEPEEEKPHWRHYEEQEDQKEKDEEENVPESAPLEDQDVAEAPPEECPYEHFGEALVACDHKEVEHFSDRENLPEPHLDHALDHYIDHVNTNMDGKLDSDHHKMVKTLYEKRGEDFRADHSHALLGMSLSSSAPIAEEPPN